MDKKLEWTDVHTHLNMLDIAAEVAVEEAELAGVTQMVTIGTEPEDWPKVIHFSNTFPQIKGALGMHPHCAKLYNDEVEKVLKESLDKAGIVACGEIGLDYYYEYSEKEKQKEVFYRQMMLAKEKKRPVEIHTRSAEKDTIKILKQFSGSVRGLLHCFSGTWSLAKEALDLGFNISFSGIITFKKADDLREVCQKIPLDRLHLETDAPYLAPAPHRGKQNKPAWVVHTAQVVANLHKVSLSELSERTQDNYTKLFAVP
ncbi:MAG: TatD family hydrolase [Bdellovibrionales bacterium]|nr:TatD family hydrolase [Bdellovibrionales bacterium]